MAEVDFVKGGMKASGNSLVRLATFKGEPMGRLAEQRLVESGIPAFLQPEGLHLGVAFQATYFSLWVRPEDVVKAREALELEDSTPVELLERAAARTWPRAVLLLFLLAVLALMVGLIDLFINLLFR